MIDEAMRAKLMEPTDILLSVPAEIGLDEVWQEVKYGLHISDDREVKRITLDIVREMPRRGA